MLIVDCLSTLYSASSVRHCRRNRLRTGRICQDSPLPKRHREPEASLLSAYSYYYLIYFILPGIIGNFAPDNIKKRRTRRLRHNWYYVVVRKKKKKKVFWLSGTETKPIHFSFEKLMDGLFCVIFSGCKTVKITNYNPNSLTLTDKMMY